MSRRVLILPVLVLGLADRCVAQQFIRGDANRDGRVTYQDVIVMMNGIFRGGEILCRETFDVNDDGDASLSDANLLLAWATYQAGAQPPKPHFPRPGLD